MTTTIQVNEFTFSKHVPAGDPLSGKEVKVWKTLEGETCQEEADAIKVVLD